MNETLYNPETGVSAIPLPTVTPEQTLSARVQGFVPTPPQTITSSALVPTQPLSLPRQIPQTAYQGLGAYVEQAATNGINKYQADVKQQEQLALNAQKQQMGQQKQSIFDQILGRRSQIGLESQEYAKTNDVGTSVNTTKQELNEINQQILAESVAARRRIEAIEKSGGTQGGIELQVRQIQKESASKQADLAVIQYAKQGNYSLAKEIADRKVDAVLEEDRIKIDALKFIYQENKEQFNKTEEREFQQTLKKEERDYEKKERELMDLKDTKLNLLRLAGQQQAPASIMQAIQSAPTEAAAITAAGQYGGDILERKIKQIQIAKILSEVTPSAGTVTGPNGKPLNDTQAKALSYARRVADASTIIDEIGDDFTGVDALIEGYSPNMFKSPNRQKFDQAQRNFVNAVLRRESGAVIAESEFENAKLQYFPQVGDSAEVIEQKKLNRERTLEGMLIEGGQRVGLPNQTVINVGGQKVLPGTVITNSAGQKGRVNPDGTVTPL